VREFLDEVWSGGNIAACASYLAPAYTIHHDPGDPWEGQTLDLASFQSRARASRAPFPDQRFLIQRVFADGETVAVTWAWGATHAGDIPGFPATGKPVKMSGATVYFLDSATRICGHWQIADRLGVFQQLQASKA
jgi:predicted ester cyclase